MISPLTLPKSRKRLRLRRRNIAREGERLQRIAAALSGPDRAPLQATADENLVRANELEARAKATDASEQLDATSPSKLVEINGGVVKLTSNREHAGERYVLSVFNGASDAKSGAWRIVTIMQPEADRRLGDQQIAWIDKLEREGPGGARLCMALLHLRRQP